MILNQVLLDIKTTGFEKKLLGGIVLTGGGAMIKNLPQLTEYITGGIATRIGESDSNIAKLPTDMADIRHPMYATGIGLVIKGFEYYEENDDFPEIPVEEPQQPIMEETQETPELEKKEEPKKEDKKEKKKKVKKPKEGGLAAKINKILRGIISDGVE